MAKRKTLEKERKKTGSGEKEDYRKGERRLQERRIKTGGKRIKTIRREN